MTDEHLLRALGKELAAEQDALLQTESHIPSARQKLLLNQRAKPALKRHLTRLLAAAAVIGGGTFLVTALLPQPATIQVLGVKNQHQPPVGTWMSAPHDRTLPLRFSDGTQVLLAPRSRARVIDANENGAHVVVEAGSAQVQVVPRKTADWKLSFGPFVVEVVGTKFAVDWDPDQDKFRLVLHEGRVRVSGCVFGDGRLLLPGDRLDASCKNARFEISSGRTPTSSVPVASTPAAPPAVAPAPAPTPASQRSGVQPSRPEAKLPAKPTWQELALDNDYRAAFASATKLGFETECARVNAEDLILLADAARFSGNGTQASRAYQIVRQRFPGSAQASRAAFALARQAFDQRRAYAEAARWFETYLQEQPNGGFAREALGRLMEALSSAGDSGRAQQTAESYLARYPSGPHAAVARQLLQPNR